MRIRWRLAFYGSFVALISMIVFAVALTWLARQAGPEDQLRALGTLADSVASDTANTPDEAFDNPAPIATVDPSQSTEAFYVIVDDQGEVLLSSGLLEGRSPEIASAVIAEALSEGSAEAVQTLDDLELQLVARRWTNPDNESSGVVVVGQSTLFIEEQLEGLGTVLAIAGIITLVVSAIVGWFVTRRALKPIRQLAATTDAIGATGDLTRRLPQRKTKDELGILTSSFNEMLDRLADAQTQLARSLDAQRQFVADASHELRSPLTTIRSNAGFLIDRPDVSAIDRSEAIGDIAEEADRMTGLVDDLLVLARSDADVLVESDPVDLVEVLSAVLHHIGPEETTVNVPVEAVVEGDRRALHRLIRTLVDNARRHGGGEVEVSLVAANAPGGVVLLSVADRGPGFPAEDLVKVFDRFYRADPSRHAAGTGLGMAIAKGIVEAHGGRILAANRAGGGAVIEVELTGFTPP